MRIGILGSGLMGGKLGVIFARAGHDVVFSYSRDPVRLEELAREAGPGARSGKPGDASRDAEVLLLAVHWTRVDDVLDLAGDVSRKIIVTFSLPMSADDSRLVITGSSSGAEEVARKVPEAKVVCAFGTVPSEVLFPVFEAKGIITSPSLLYCGDDDAAKEVTAGLIRDTGFEPLDVGELQCARYLEPFTLAVARLAYESDSGPELAYRFERFGNAE
jgi:predicted dinucleotide-binding enzyme